MKFKLKEENKKKKKWKNGLSITPFVIHKDAGNVEKGIDNFNNMTVNSNCQGACQAMGESAVNDRSTKNILNTNSEEKIITSLAKEFNLQPAYGNEALYNLDNHNWYKKFDYAEDGDTDFFAGKKRIHNGFTSNALKPYIEFENWSKEELDKVEDLISSLGYSFNRRGVSYGHNFTKDHYHDVVSNVRYYLDDLNEAIEAGQIDKAREIERDIQWYEEKEDDQPYNKDEYEDEINNLKQDLKENKMEFKHLHESKESEVSKVIEGVKFIYDSEEDMKDNLDNDIETLKEITNDHYLDMVAVRFTPDYIEVTDHDGNKEKFEYIAGRLFHHDEDDKLNESIDDDLSVKDLISFVKVNAPRSREEAKPAAREDRINEISIPDNMRYKQWNIEAVNDDLLQLDWTTQEPFTSEDSEKFIAEIKRFFEALVEREEFHKPFTVMLNVEARDGRDRGELVYDIDINKEENEEMKLVNESVTSKNRLVWDDCTPTYERRATTEEDIENDIHVKEFNTAEELLSELVDLANAEEDELEEDSTEGKIEELLSWFNDPGDGSPNIFYISVNGKELDEVYPYDELEYLDLATCSERDVKDALLGEDDEDIDESLKEDLNNVTEVEDKAKEVMEPAFASAVREIRSHDKGRAELKKLRKAPKEGEESLPKDLKMNLDESLFTEWVEDENLNEHLFHAKPGVYVNTEDERDWIKIGDNGRIHSVSSGEIINDGFGTKVNGTKYIVDAREGGPDRLYVYSYDDNGVDKSFPFVFKLSNRKIEEDAEFLNRIKSPVSDDVELSADMNLRDAYTAYEPEEFQLDRLRNDITLKEVWEKMKAGEDIYELASVDGQGFDSAVREGIFVMLEMVLGIDYDTIYNTWLYPEMKESCSKEMNESEESDKINMTSEEYLEAVRQGGGWVTVEKIEFDTDYETIDVDDVLNKALASGWKFVNHPEHGLCIVAKGFEIKDE